jgi:uncharacterized membrane protein
VAALAAAGLAISAYLTGAKLAGATALFCESGSGCDVVQASRYAVFLGFPTAAWGAGLYALVGGLALAGLSARRWLWVFVLAVAAVAFSAYLTWLALFELGAVCPWCLADAAIAAALLAVLLARRPVATGRRSWVRPRRLATLGVLTAAVTIVVGMGVFVAGAPSAGSAYQDALARHLTASGAIFYGAYW